MIIIDMSRALTDAEKTFFKHMSKGHKIVHCNPWPLDGAEKCAVFFVSTQAERRAQLDLLLRDIREALAQTGPAGAALAGNKKLKFNDPALLEWQRENGLNKNQKPRECYCYTDSWWRRWTYRRYGFLFFEPRGINRLFKRSE